MVTFNYKPRDTKEYLNAPHTDKLTMTDGVDNFDWAYICELREECATLATELRTKLEELQDVMFKQEQCYIKDADGDYEGIDSYTIEDYAAQVAEIENNLSINEED